VLNLLRFSKCLIGHDTKRMQGWPWVLASRAGHIDCCMSFPLAFFISCAVGTRCFAVLHLVRIEFFRTWSLIGLAVSASDLAVLGAMLRVDLLCSRVEL
jgi:hypothetical protein